MKADELKEIFRIQGIQRVQVVDDAFDEIPRALLDAVSIQSFIDRVGEAQFETLRKLLGDAEGEDSIIEQLCNDLDVVAKLYRDRAAFQPHVDVLFQKVESKRDAEQQRLRPLMEVLDRACPGGVLRTGAREYVPPSDPIQMLLVDLKLDSETTVVTPDSAIRVIQSCMRTHKDEDVVIVLMSSLTTPLANDNEDVRSRCELFRTQFEILDKSTFDSGTHQLSWLLADLARNRRFIAQMREHRYCWKQALSRAAGKLDDMLRDLDVPDFFLLRDGVARNEGGLGSYISELMREYVSHSMAGSTHIAKFSENLDNWDGPDHDRPPRTQFRRHRAIEELYESNMLLTSIAGDVRLGDVYLSMERDRQQTRAAVVVTPDCDLVPGREVDRIFACEGNVKPLEGDQWLGKKGETTPLLFRGETASFEIQWNLKLPLTIERSELRTQMPQDNVPTGWVRIGRLRPIFALEVQQALNAKQTRVGVPATPTVIPHHVVEVLVLDGVDNKKKWRRLDEDVRGRVDGNSSFMIQDTDLRSVLTKVLKWCKDNGKDELLGLLEPYDAYTKLKYAMKPKRHEKNPWYWPLDGLQDVSEKLRRQVIFTTIEQSFKHDTRAQNESVLIVFKFGKTT